MASKLTRVTKNRSVILTNVLGTTPALDITRFTTCMVCFPAGYAAATYTVYGRNPVDGSYLKLRAPDGTALENLAITAASAQCLSECVFNATHIKLVLNTAAAVAVGVVMKA